MPTNRLIEATLHDHFTQYRQALVLLGARQVGKTTLLRRLFPDALYLLVDNEEIRARFETYNIDTYKTIIAQSQQIFIDELHLLSDPGRAVKIIYDQIPGIQIIVTGSSSFHIKNKTAESMAGRKIEYELHPLTFFEYLFQQGTENKLQAPIIQNILQNNQARPKLYNQRELVSAVLLNGLYPATLNLAGKKDYLRDLARSAIFQDIIALNLIENRAKALDLLKLLAYQIGNLINVQELASKLSIDRRTVERYLEIFEQSFIVFRLYPYSQNSRYEIGKTPKIYFWDLGLRNALINRFDSIDLRPDAGAMFENFIIAEVKKEIKYLDLDYEIKYWRLKSGSEIDLVLHDHRQLIGCEIKLSTGRISPAFLSRYPQARTHLLTADNFA